MFWYSKDLRLRYTGLGHSRMTPALEPLSSRRPSTSVPPRGLFVYSSVITDFPAGAGVCRGVDSRAPLMMLTSGLKGKRAREKYKREGVLKGRLLSPIRTLGFSPWGLNPESECL